MFNLTFLQHLPQVVYMLFAITVLKPKRGFKKYR